MVNIDFRNESNLDKYTMKLILICLTAWDFIHDMGPTIQATPKIQKHLDDILKSIESSDQQGGVSDLSDTSTQDTISLSEPMDAIQDLEKHRKYKNLILNFY